jgi:hypothetical protein
VSTLTLLNLIDSNLRKEYVMTGVIHWSLNKLLPLMLSAELTVRTRYRHASTHLTFRLEFLLPIQWHHFASWKGVLGRARIVEQLGCVLRVLV